MTDDPIAIWSIDGTTGGLDRDEAAVLADWLSTEPRLDWISLHGRLCAALDADAGELPIQFEIDDVPVLHAVLNGVEVGDNHRLAVLQRDVGAEPLGWAGPEDAPFYVPGTGMVGDPARCVTVATQILTADLGSRFPSDAGVRQIAVELLAEREPVEDVEKDPSLIADAVLEARERLHEGRNPTRPDAD